VKILVSGENATPAVVVDGRKGVVIEAAAGLVSSVNGQTGGVVLDAATIGADPAGSADTAETEAIAAAAAGTTVQVAAHAAAIDPHGDRAYAQTLVPVDWINVTKGPYNAAGDGAIDDTAAIQAALTAAANTGGGVVYLPAGTYKISTALTISDNVSIRGAGDLATVIRQTSTTAHGLVGTDLNNVTITDLGVTGPVTGTGKGINFTLTSAPCTMYINMGRVTVKNFGSDGINIQQPIVSTFTRVVSQANGGWGFNLHTNADTGPAGTSCQFTACYGNGNATGGYRLHKLTYIQLSACAADSQTVGYELDFVYGASLNGCGGEDNTTTIKVNGGGGISIAGQFITASKGTGIWVTGGAKPVGIYGAYDMDPNGATAFIKSDAATTVTLTNVVNTTANSLAAGTATTLADANGAATFAGGVTANGTFSFFGGLVEVATHLVTDNGNVSINGVGKGLLIKEGTNAKMGTATLNGTTAVTVATTAVTANSRIQLTINTPGGTPGSPYVSARTAGTSFQIKSTGASDTSVVAWLIVEPA
jgi:hypothetical protein